MFLGTHQHGLLYMGEWDYGNGHITSGLYPNLDNEDETGVIL